MNFKRFGRTAQLFDASTAVIGKRVNASGTETNADMAYSDYIDVQGVSKLTVSHKPAITNFYFYEEKTPTALSYVNGYTADVPVNAKYCRINLLASDVNVTMLNAGDTALPYEPYGSAWHDIPHYIMATSTDTITTLPADIYANDTTATVGLKGDMSQSSTPSPSSPVMPQECGDLETTGEHTGQYKIPILSNSTTTSVYLGEVRTTRRIKKLVLTGQESGWTRYAPSVAESYLYYLTGLKKSGASNCICTHVPYKSHVPNASDAGVRISDSRTTLLLNCGSTTIANNTVEDFKAWLQQQYTNGTPVCVWYVLATPQTAVVNEPLRKIGDYADSISGITIPTIAGANTISVDTTLQPSEVTVTYKGWHPVTDVHERENGAWD